MKRQRTCESCGDTLLRVIRDDIPIPTAARPLLATHCLECAVELSTGKIPPAETTQHGTGGGKRIVRKAEPMS